MEKHWFKGIIRKKHGLLFATYKIRNRSNMWSQENIWFATNTNK